MAASQPKEGSILFQGSIRYIDVKEKEFHIKRRQDDHNLLWKLSNLTEYLHVLRYVHQGNHDLEFEMSDDKTIKLDTVRGADQKEWDLAESLDSLWNFWAVLDPDKDQRLLVKQRKDEEASQSRTSKEGCWRCR